MRDKIFIFRSFGYFYRYRPLRLILIFLATLVQGFTQGITIVLLIPLLGLLDQAQSTPSSNQWVDLINPVFEKMGIEVSITLILSVYALCIISIALLNYFLSVMQVSYQQGFSYNIRKRLYKKVITSEWSFLNGKSKHNHIQVLTTEVPKMSIYYYYYLELAKKMIFIITHTVLAAFILWYFTLLVVIAGIFVFILLRGYLKRASFLGAGNIQISRKMLKQIDDFWQTVKIAKVHNSEEFYYKKFNDTNISMLANQYRQTRNRVFPQLLFTLAGILTLTLFIYFAFNVAHIALPSLFVFILLFARIFPHFMSVNNDINMLLSMEESVKMVLKLDAEIPERDFERVSSTEMVQFRERLEIKNLTFSYDNKKQIFKNFSESIPFGSLTGITGKSGCGKTTLLDIIAGIQNVDGALYLDGEELNRAKMPVWRRMIGYLPQDSFFIDGTIRENLVWDSVAEIDDESIMNVLRSVDAEELVLRHKMELDTYVANYPFHFSGGERQRLALARVLIRKPRLLLLDEATSSLDAASETQIMECLVRLKAHVTIIFVTHKQNLSGYFDKVIDFK